MMIIDLQITFSNIKKLLWTIENKLISKKYVLYLLIMFIKGNYILSSNF